MPQTPARRLVVVSNRVPARDTPQAGGLAVALSDALVGRDALWFGWSGKIGAPRAQMYPGAPTLAEIDLPQDAYDGYYKGFSNSCLWPLMHSDTGRMLFKRADHAAYTEVNGLFAEYLLPLLRPDDLVWVQDYHLMEMGQALRAKGWTGLLGFFLHIPFPSPDMFSLLPVAQPILDGLAAFDLVGVQTPQDAVHLHALAPGIRVGVYPVGIDIEEFAQQARRAEQRPDVQRFIGSLPGPLVVGVDRLDYTKGLGHRFEALTHFLTQWPEYRSHLTVLQVGAPSRSDVLKYRELQAHLDQQAGHIQGTFGRVDGGVLRYITQSQDRAVLAGMYRRAQVGWVSPLRDGMNLVAKEFVAAQNPVAPGALLLSRFAGAHTSLDGALLVNPFDPEGMAQSLHVALNMPVPERIDRWIRMMDGLRATPPWAPTFLRALEDLAM